MVKKGGVFARTFHGYRARLTVLVAAVLACTMAVTLADAVVPLRAEAAVPQRPAKPAAPPLERPDELSAMVTAQVTKRRVEVVSLRTETSQTFANPDGTYTSDINARPVRVQQRDGTWKPVDTELVRTRDGDVAPVETPVDLELSGDTTSATSTLATVADGGRSVSIGWPSKLPEPILTGDTALYREVLPDVDLKLRADTEGFAKEILVKTRAAAAALDTTIRLPLGGKGVTFSLGAARELVAKDPRGRVVFTAPTPIMWDATTDPRTGEHTRQAHVGIAIESSGGNQALVLTPDRALLDDAATKYPVTIDPGVTIARTAWTFVDRGFPTTSYYKTTDNLKVGTYNAGANLLRSLVGFPVGTLAGKDILKATLNTRLVHSWSCTATKVLLYPLSAGSSFGSGTTWNNQPTVGGLAASATVAAGYSSACPAKTVPFDVTPEIDAAAAASKGSMWFQIRSGSESNTTTSNTYWKKFANNPSLSVTYNRPPGVPSPRSMVPPAKCVTGSAREFVNTLTPTFKGVAADPDGGNVRINVEVWEVNGTAAVASGITAYAASGSTFSWKPAAGALADVTPYSYRARTSDSRLWSAWSPWCEFSTDIVAPNAPGVDSTDYPAGAWSQGGGQDGVFTLSAGSGDTKGYYYGLDTPTPTTYAAAPALGGSADVTVKAIADGPHTLYVQAQDRAGNRSAVTKYVFGAGKGAVTSPATGAITAGKVALSASVPPGITGVTYQWRRGDADAWATIPAGDVTVAAGGAAVTWPQPVTDGTTAKLNWDLAKTLAAASNAADGPVQVMATFTGGPGGTGPVRFVLDRNRASAAAAGVGPGDVNLLTGDYTVSETDASVSSYDTDLSVSRSFSTRAANADPTGPFGPGWTSSLSVDGAEAEYTGVTVVGSVASVGLPDGQSLGFAVKADTDAGKTYTPEVGAEDFTLAYTAAGDRFTLADLEGTVVTFGKMTSGNVYSPTAVTTPGSDQTTTTTYESVSVGGRTVVRPTRMLAPVPTGVSCGSGTAGLVRGCRALSFRYATETTATETSTGDHAGRLVEVSFTAWDPDADTPGMRTVPVARYAYDADGRLRAAWDPRLDHDGASVRTTYAYHPDGTLAALAAPGENPWRFAYTTVPGDGAPGRFASASRELPDTGTATTTVVYRVPVSGSGAPYDLSPAQTARWAQGEAPVDATAVFGPQQVPDGDQAAGGLPSSYERATVTYLDANGRPVDVASPGGHIATTTYDQFGNTVRTLTGGNRERALAAGADSAEVATRLDTQTRYDRTGQRVLAGLGPEHDTALPDGTVAPARRHTVVRYDEGIPEGTGPYHLPTSVTTGARPAGAAGDVTSSSGDVDVRTSTTEYDWELRRAVRSTMDPDGAALTHRTTFDPDTGLAVRTTAPGGTGTSSPATTEFVYYSSGAHPTHPDCGNRPEWANLVCRTDPGGQAASGPELPVQMTTYSLYNEPRVETERRSSDGRVLRTVTTTYDAAGRVATTSVTGAGAAVPAIRDGYDPATGRLVATRSVDADGTLLAQVTRQYDALGRQVSYTDSTGARSEFTYDALDRLVTANDGRGIQTYGYDGGDERRGLPTQVRDSQAGTFTGGYDADGALVRETLPNGLVSVRTVDEAGNVTGLSYGMPADSGCAEDACTWLAETATYNVHGQRVTDSKTQSGQRHTYDGAGRLTQVVDTGLDGDCVTRTYRFDAAVNRIADAAYGPAEDGTCQTGTPASNRTRGYDSASRVSDAGYGYDDLGRTTTLPAADTAAGTGDVTVAYHANDLVRSLAQGGRTTTYGLDVDGTRIRTWTDQPADGSAASTRTHHYAGDGDSPAWTDEGSGYTRNVGAFATGLTAAVDSEAGTVTLQLANLHGDVVGTADATGAEPGLLSTADSTEYGLPRDAEEIGSRRYGWLGTHQRAADTPGGLVLMGVRLYNPATGRFLSVDPVPGGNANPYEYCWGDPVNCLDLDGRKSCNWLCEGAAWGAGVVAGGVCWALFKWPNLCGALAAAVTAGLKYILTRDKKHPFRWRNFAAIFIGTFVVSFAGAVGIQWLKNVIVGMAKKLVLRSKTKKVGQKLYGILKYVAEYVPRHRR